LFNLGFGFVEVGTITPKPQFGNPKPRVFRLEEDEALINRLGFNNSGSEQISQTIKENNKKGFLGINIGPNKDSTNRIDDYLICFRKFYNLADYITINISSPNTENLRDFHNQNELNLLIEKLKNEKKAFTDKWIGNKIFSKGERDNIEMKICFGNEKEPDFFLGNNNFDQLSYRLYGPLIKALKK